MVSSVTARVTVTDGVRVKASVRSGVRIRSVSGCTNGTERARREGEGETERAGKRERRRGRIKR